VCVCVCVCVCVIGNGYTWASYGNVVQIIRSQRSQCFSYIVLSQRLTGNE